MKFLFLRLEKLPGQLKLRRDVFTICRAINTHAIQRYFKHLKTFADFLKVFSRIENVVLFRCSV